MIDVVADLLRTTAAEVVLPRFQHLAAHEVEDKSPDEPVTIADREAELVLARALSGLSPGSLVVGEEATFANGSQPFPPTTGTVWLVDPIDGTANFTKGLPCFSMMIAMLRNGHTVASWMFSPVTGTMHVAEKGSGAEVNGKRVMCPAIAPPLAQLNGAVLTRFLPQEIKAAIGRNSGRVRLISPGLRCSGEEYPAIVGGRQHFALFWRALPWDHAPGALFLEEAGGCVSRLDGSRYSPGESRVGLLVAQSAKVGDALRQHLLS